MHWRTRTVWAATFVCVCLFAAPTHAGTGLGGSFRAKTAAIPKGPSPAWDELQECMTQSTPLAIQALLRVYSENLQGPSRQHQAQPVAHNVWAAKAAALFCSSYRPEENYYWMDLPDGVSPKEGLDWKDPRTQFLATLGGLLHDSGKIGMWTPSSIEPTHWHQLSKELYGNAVYEVEWAVQEHPLTGMAMCIGMDHMETADIHNCGFELPPHEWWKVQKESIPAILEKLPKCPKKIYDMRMHLSKDAERDIVDRIYGGKFAQAPIMSIEGTRWFDFGKFFSELGVTNDERAKVCHMVMAHYSFGDVNKSGVSANHAVMYARLSDTLVGDGSAADFKRRMGVFVDVINEKLQTNLENNIDLAQGSLLMGYADIAGTMYSDLQVGAREPTALNLGTCEVCQTESLLFKETDPDGKVFQLCEDKGSKWSAFAMGPSITFCVGKETAECDRMYQKDYSNGSSAGTVKKIYAEYIEAGDSDSSESDSSDSDGESEVIGVQEPVEHASLR